MRAAGRKSYEFDGVLSHKENGIKSTMPFMIVQFYNYTIFIEASGMLLRKFKDFQQ